MPNRPRRAVFVVLIALVAYVSIYTWNWRTGVLDRFAVVSGLELVGSVLSPGKWVQREATNLWERYFYLVGVCEENEALRLRMEALNLQAASLQEKAAQGDRLLDLLHFTPPLDWVRTGARVVGHRLGANAVLETLLIDKGTVSGVVRDTPVVAPLGVVGRVHRPGAHFSTVLLLIDPNSHVPVMGAEHRIPAIVVGQGAGKPLLVSYVPLNDTLAKGELLITSGLGGMFPKGLPVARVSGVERSPISLFQDIRADLLVDPGRLEELLLLLPRKGTLQDDSVLLSHPEASAQ